jgi:hypothetical protein
MTPSSKDNLKREQVMALMKSGLENVQMELAFELFNERVVMAIILPKVKDGERQDFSSQPDALLTCFFRQGTSLESTCATAFEDFS